MIRTHEQYRELLEQRLNEQGLMSSIGSFIGKKVLPTFVAGTMVTGVPGVVQGKQYGSSYSQSSMTSTDTGSQALNRGASDTTSIGRTSNIMGTSISNTLPDVRVQNTFRNLSGSGSFGNYSNNNSATTTTVGNYPPQIEKTKQMVGQFGNGPSAQETPTIGGSGNSTLVSKGAATPFANYTLTGKNLEALPATRRRTLAETIVKRKNKECVVSKKGKNLGCSSSHAGAVKRLRQVEYFKHMSGINESFLTKRDLMATSTKELRKIGDTHSRAVSVIRERAKEAKKNGDHKKADDLHAQANRHQDHEMDIREIINNRVGMK